MRITVFCSSNKHPVFSYLESWKNTNSYRNDISLVTNLDDIHSGDILFLISVTQLVKKDVREKFKKTLVIHGSDLPKGKGWSPIVWQVLNGAKKFTLTLFEAVDKVDAGPIWKKESFELEGHELYDEINEKCFKIELKLMDYALNFFDTVNPIEQSNKDESYFNKRNLDDSIIDPQKSILEQFNLLRVADENRYPAFFYHLDHKYKIILKKFDD